MIVFICIMLIVVSGFTLLYTIGESTSRQQEEDKETIRRICYCICIIAFVIGVIFGK